VAHVITAQKEEEDGDQDDKKDPSHYEQEGEFGYT